MSSPDICDKPAGKTTVWLWAANSVVILVSTATAFSTFSALLFVLDVLLKEGRYASAAELPKSSEAPACFRGSGGLLSIRVILLHKVALNG
jgi:hypothetical protein